MFIDWASQLHLLNHDPAQNILKDFSLPVKKIMVSQVVTFLLEGNNFKTLTSPSHVIYALETCGQGFSLPIEEEDSITKVINLYQSWSLDGKGKRPSAIDDDSQFFIQRMLSHFSLLFEPRAQTKELVDKHGSLCSRVLDIFAQIGRTIGQKLSTQTWELFLKLLISITDILLHPELPANQEPLQRRLCPQLLRVLFELWILSRTRNPDLWHALKLRVHNWTHHISLILTWRATCFALTKRSIAILYGVSEGTELVTIKFEDNQQILNFQLEDEYVFYVWHRMLNIIGNPNYTIHNPAIYLAFICGVENLVQLYLMIGRNSKKALAARFIAPTGNTIFHLFGSWLFDSIHLDRNSFDEGTALALKIISTIISIKYKTDLLSVYIASYFSSLQIALSKEGRVLLAAITSSTSLFTLNIKGIRSLVPYFVGGIQRILSKRVSGFENVMSIDQVRKSCLTILSTILSLPNYFKDTKFMLRAKDKVSKIYDVESYSSLKKHFSTILSDALNNETCPSNIEILLNLIQIWQIEDIPYSTEFTKSSISLIVRKITQSQTIPSSSSSSSSSSSNSWSPEVCLFAIKALLSISNLYEYLENGDEQANLVVTSLCKYLTTLLLNHSSNDSKVIEEIIVHLYKCINGWIMRDQWILQFNDTRSLYLKTIVHGLRGGGAYSQIENSSNLSMNSTHHQIANKEEKEKEKEKEKKKKDKKAEKQNDKKSNNNNNNNSELSSSSSPLLAYRMERIKEVAHNTLLVFVNYFGNFPTASGASIVSTLAKEEEILQNIMKFGQFANTSDTKEYIRYFITDDKVIFCIIDRRFNDFNHNHNSSFTADDGDHNNNNNNDNDDDNYNNNNNGDDDAPKVCIIVRDKTGRYAWDSKLTILPYTTNPETPQYTNHDLPLNICMQPTITQSIIDSEKIQQVSEYLSKQITSKAFKGVEHQVVTEQKLLKFSNFKLDSNISIQVPKAADPYIGDCKIQQSRLFFSHLGLLSLENRDKLYPLQMNESFFTSLRSFDQLSERECIKAAVVYIRKGQVDEEFFGNEGGSMDYQEFLASLGWGVHVHQHKGYLGNIEAQYSLTGVTPYWSNHSTEILFHVTTLMSNCSQYPDHLHKKRQILGAVVVVVWTEDYSDFNAQIWASSRHNIVFVVITPLEYGLYYVRVLSKNDLLGVGPLVDGCIVSKSILGYLVRETSITAFRRENLDVDSPFQQRSIHLENIYQQFKKEMNLEQFYSSLFTSLSSDQIGPLQILDPPSQIHHHRHKSHHHSSDNVSSSSSSSPSTNTPVANQATPPRNWVKPPTSRERKGEYSTQRARNTTPLTSPSPSENAHNDNSSPPSTSLELSDTSEKKDKKSKGLVSRVKKTKKKDKKDESITQDEPQEF